MIIPDLAALAVPIEQLELLPGNPRRGDIDAVAASLDRFGQRKPIVVRRGDRTVIAGNHTLQAARRLGWLEIAVVWVDDDDAHAKAFALADNRTAELGDYDEEALLALIEQVHAADAELLEMTGWAEQDMHDLIEQLRPEPVVSPEDADDVPESVVSRTVKGDVWLLGPHRLMCGDSTVPTDVARLMAGAKADMVWTDPPYGVDYVAMRGSRKIANDNDLSTAEQVTREALLLSSANVAFVCCNWRSMPPMIDAMIDAGVAPKACIVWDKQRRVQNLDRFAKQHEFILYAGPYGGTPTVDVDVWQIARDFDPDHPTPKPVELVQRSITAASRTNDVIFDPFGGSGSTLIAAQACGRVAYLMELDEHYCDVICARFQQLTGILPIAEATGNEHDFLKDA